MTDSGSVMHGMLMDMLPAPWPDKLHRIEKQIFSQWLEVSEHQENIWHIGILDDELADEMLFQMDDRAESVLRELLAREGLSMARRAEPGHGLDAAEQEHFFERIGSTIPEAHLTEHGALFPAKSMMYGVDLSREECHVALHDCSRCPKTDCLYRKMPKNS